MDPETNLDVKENVNNTPRLAPSTLEVERLRMQMTMKKTGNTNVDTVGEIPTMPTQRGVRRLKSSNPNIVSRNASGPLAAPTRSTDAAASLRGSAVARANSSRNLLQRATSSNSTNNPLTRNGIPARTTSSQGLRSYNKDQIVNSSISRKPSTDGILNMHIRGPGGTLGLQRNESEMSLGEFSISDGSLFTTDSVFVRKAQCNIADPIDNDETHTYYADDDSFADHESFMTRDSDVHLLYEMPTRNPMTPSTTNELHHPPSQHKSHGRSTHARRPEQPPSAIKTTMTLDDLESLKLSRLNISASGGHGTNGGGVGDDISLISYGTMASGLTTDYTDHDFTDGYNMQEQVEEE